MAYELIAFGNNAPRVFQGLELYAGAQCRAWLPPALATSVSVSSGGGSPNGRVAASYSGSLRIHTDPTDFGQVITPSIQPSGAAAGNSIAVSNDLVAVIGGTTSPVLVFDHAGNNVAASFTGMGTIQRLQFLSAGARLAVFHSTGLRIYNTSTWAFVDASTTGGPKYGITQADNGATVVHSVTSPFNHFIDLDTGAVTAISALSAYTAAPNAASAPIFCADPSNPACIFMGRAGSSGAGAKLARFNTATSVVTPITEFEGKQNANNPIRQLIADHWLNRVYILLATGTATAFGNYQTLLALNPQTLVFEDDARFVGLSDALSSYFLLGAYLRGHADRSLISGSVRDLGNNPAAREVRAYHSATGRLVGVTNSNAAGEYTLRLGTLDSVDVVFKALPAENLNDLIFARVTPQPYVP